MTQYIWYITLKHTLNEYNTETSQPTDRTILKHHSTQDITLLRQTTERRQSHTATKSDGEKVKQS